MPGYNFSVVIKDGVATVMHMTPGIEDGIWEVGGTDDGFGASINITYKRPSGQYVAEAQHYSNPENYKAPEIPGLEQLKAAFISMGFSPAVAEKSALESLSKMSVGPAMPSSAPDMPPGLRNPAEARDTPGWKAPSSPGVEGDTLPPGAKPFDYNDKSTWPEPLRKVGADSPEDDSPRMRGDVQM